MGLVSTSLVLIMSKKSEVQFSKFLTYSAGSLKYYWFDITKIQKERAASKSMNYPTQ
jgi:hypothetical protein